MIGRDDVDFSALLKEFADSVEASQSELLDEVREAVRALGERIGAAEESWGELRPRLEEMERRLADLEEGTVPRSGIAPARGETPASVLQVRTRHAEIWKLAQAGCDEATIARRSLRPLGEIRLILRLMKAPEMTLPLDARKEVN